MQCLPGFNVYALLTVDLLHEIEIGVWKSLFMHILRLLQLLSRDGCIELDRRYVYPMPILHHLHLSTNQSPGFGVFRHLVKTPFEGLLAMLQR